MTTATDPEDKEIGAGWHVSQDRDLWWAEPEPEMGWRDLICVQTFAQDTTEHPDAAPYYLRITTARPDRDIDLADPRQRREALAEAESACLAPDVAEVLVYALARILSVSPLIADVNQVLTDASKRDAEDTRALRDEEKLAAAAARPAAEQAAAEGRDPAQMKFRIRDALRFALGDDFAVTNSGFGPGAAAWFRAYAGPDLVVEVTVTPAATGAIS